MKNIKYMKLSRYTVLIMSISFIIIGLNRGENATVLKKAVNICLECIGIG